jgi:hypothetical protein
VIGGRHHCFFAAAADSFKYSCVISSHDKATYVPRGACLLQSVQNQRFTGDLQKQLSRQAGRRIPRRNDRYYILSGIIAVLLHGILE